MKIKDQWMDKKNCKDLPGFILLKLIGDVF